MKTIGCNLTEGGPAVPHSGAQGKTPTKVKSFERAAKRITLGKSQ